MIKFIWKNLCSSPHFRPKSSTFLINIGNYQKLYNDMNLKYLNIHFQSHESLPSSHHKNIWLFQYKRLCITPFATFSHLCNLLMRKCLFHVQCSPTIYSFVNFWYFPLSLVFYPPNFFLNGTADTHLSADLI